MLLTSLAVLLSSSLCLSSLSGPFLSASLLSLLLFALWFSLVPWILASVQTLVALFWSNGGEEGTNPSNVGEMDMDGSVLLGLVCLV